MIPTCSAVVFYDVIAYMIVPLFPLILLIDVAHVIHFLCYFFQITHHIITYQRKVSTIQA